MKNQGGLIFIGIILFIIIKTCSDKKTTNYAPVREREVTPVSQLIDRLSSEKNFSIILRDMNMSGDKYYHKYDLLVEHPDTVLTQSTDWMVVSAAFFNSNINNMGMEIASKKDGIVSKVASPAGYNNYIGNEKYGQWVQRNGSSFWEFYGKYAFMSSMFNLLAYPAHRSYWSDYHGGGYYGSRPYYGPSGRAVYGTKPYTSSGRGKSSSWGSRPSAFKNQVRSQVARPRAKSSASSYRSPSSSRTARSSSRYSGYSSRSRGGSFGK